jgi:hypothetical protein
MKPTGETEMNTNKWRHIQTFGQYYDFERELFSWPDEGNTSVDMRLTFNAETRTCYYHTSLHNDSGESVDQLTPVRHVPWAVGLETLSRDNFDIPEELK